MAKKPQPPRGGKRTRIDIDKFVVSLQDAAAIMRGSPTPLELPLNTINELIGSYIEHIDQAEQVVSAIRIVILSKVSVAEKRGYSRQKIRAIRRRLTNALDMMESIVGEDHLAEELLTEIKIAAEIYLEMIKDLPGRK
jgi:hypothetical protein